MKRTRGTNSEIFKPLENPENLVRKKKKNEGPSQPVNEEPLDATPIRATPADTSIDTSALIRTFIRTPPSVRSPTEEDPSEETFPPRDEQPNSPPRIPQNLPISDPQPNSPISPVIFPSPADQIHSSAGSTNGFQSALSVQLDALARRLYSMDQTMERRFYHIEQAIQNHTMQMDQLRSWVHRQEEGSTLLLRELGEIRDEQRRQREELRAVRIELREVRK